MVDLTVINGGGGGDEPPIYGPEELAADLFSLRLGEACVSMDFTAVRVPGGWVVTPSVFGSVTEDNGKTGVACCFVPYSTEFKPEEGDRDE